MLWHNLIHIKVHKILRYTKYLFSHALQLFIFYRSFTAWISFCLFVDVVGCILVALLSHCLFYVGFGLGFTTMQHICILPNVLLLLLSCRFNVHCALPPQSSNNKINTCNVAKTIPSSDMTNQIVTAQLNLNWSWCETLKWVGSHHPTTRNF